ncbi:protein kinase [Vicingaceae bacterium]|nr:protein kinase [Vicingaceae bacterium]
MKLKQVKVGKFTPKCSECGKKFLLHVAKGPDDQIQIRTGSPKQSSQANDKTRTAVPEQKRSSAKSTRNRDEDLTTSHRQVGEPTKKPHESTVESPIAGRSDSDFKDLTHTDRGQTGTTRVDKNVTRSERMSGSNIPENVPKQLGGYRLVERIGRGGMGTVFRARQMSLDRDVALKVVRSKLAGDPAAIARFTREAYAAAQLTHHNVVQIYDMGDQDGNCFFSMELINGPSLDKVVKEYTKLDPEQAASYVLQAARGLQIAHNSGMVHRDIKPANLLVNEKGVVKVADLGLVKVPDAEDIEANEEFQSAAALSASQDLTVVGTGVGTVNYMAPEQARNAATVDHRADIYSLGCTFYVLLTGRPPFKGDSAKEVVSKHMHEELVRPDQIVENVPQELAKIVAKMMAKKPESRYSDLGLVITELENFLGVISAGKFTPAKEDANTLTACVNQFHASPLLKIRDFVMPAIVLGCLLLAVAIANAGPRWASALIVLAVVAVVSYFIVRGLSLRTHLFEKVRELIARSRIIDWLVGGVGLVLLIASSFFLGTILHWLVALLLGVGIGVGIYFAFDSAIEKQRAGCIASANQLAIKLREKGTDERTIHNFFAKYSGVNWEELFETLFGYPAKRKMRNALATGSHGKKKFRKFRPWRDRIIDRIDARLNRLDAEKETRHLQKVEQAGLVSQGVSDVEARAQAAEMATALVEQAAQQKIRALQEKIAKFDPVQARENKRTKVKELLAEARSGKYSREKSQMELLTPRLNLFLGGRVRFLFGALLLTGFLIWFNQNELFETYFGKVQQSKGFDEFNEGVTEAGKKLIKAVDGEDEPELRDTEKKWTSLDVPVIGGLFQNFNPGVAGLILVLSIGVPGWRMSMFVVPAVIVVLFGPEIYPDSDITCMIIGAIIAGSGVLLGHTDD